MGTAVALEELLRRGCANVLERVLAVLCSHRVTLLDKSGEATGCAKQLTYWRRAGIAQG